MLHLQFLTNYLHISFSLFTKNNIDQNLLVSLIKNRLLNNIHLGYWMGKKDTHRSILYYLVDRTMMNNTTMSSVEVNIKTINNTMVNSTAMNNARECLS